jgi:prepilin-type processing-associated H-X9-DG protein
MKIVLSAKRETGLTRLEVFVIIGVIGFFALMILPAGSNPRGKEAALRARCANNLKQIGLSFRVWPGGCGDKWQTQLSTNYGGTKEFIDGPNAFRHFEIMSNELGSDPKLLLCPAETDRARFSAAAFSSTPQPGAIPFTSNSNLSYFVGVDAMEVVPMGILSGDHNLTNGTVAKDAILVMTTDAPAGWTAEVHNERGNILLADGSVQQLNTQGLRNAETNSMEENFTNRLQMPILSP